MKGKLVVGLVIIASATVLSLVLVWAVNSGKEDKNPYHYSVKTNREEVKTTSKEVEVEEPTNTVIVKTVYVDVDDVPYYESDDGGDLSFWYCRYDVTRNVDEHKWEGFVIVRLESSYFDVRKAIKQCHRGFKEGDFVSITFFKRVTHETYQAF